MLTTTTTTTTIAPSTPSTPSEPPRKPRFLGGSGGTSWTRSLSNLRKEAQGPGSGSGSGLGGRSRPDTPGTGGLTVDDLDLRRNEGGGESGLRLGGERSMRMGGSSSLSTSTPPSSSSGLTQACSFSSSSTPTLRSSNPTKAPAKGLRAFFHSFKRSRSTPSAPTRSISGGGGIKPKVPPSKAAAETSNTAGPPAIQVGLPSMTEEISQPINNHNDHHHHTDSPIDPSHILLPPSPPLINLPTLTPIESNEHHPLDRARTIGSMDTEPSLGITEGTIVTPVTSMEGDREAGLGVVVKDHGREEEEDGFEMGDEKASGVNVKQINGGVGGQPPVGSLSTKALGSGDETPTPTLTPTPTSPSLIASTTTNLTRPTIDTSSSTLSLSLPTTNPINPAQTKPNSTPVLVPSRSPYVRSTSTGVDCAAQPSRSPPVANSARYSQQQYPRGSPPFGYQQVGISPGGLMRSASHRFRQHSLGGGNHKSYGPTSSSSNPPNPHGKPRRRNTHRMSVSPTMYTMGGVFVESEEIMDKDEKRLTEAVFCS